MKLEPEKYVSHAILYALGGEEFTAMTGAKNFLSLRNGFQFDLPARLAGRGINKVSITLSQDDLFDVSFLKYNPRTLSVDEVEVFTGVYISQLQRCFAETTGLDCSLGRMSPKKNKPRI